MKSFGGRCRAQRPPPTQGQSQKRWPGTRPLEFWPGQKLHGEWGKNIWPGQRGGGIGKVGLGERPYRGKPRAPTDPVKYNKSICDYYIYNLSSGCNVIKFKLKKYFARFLRVDWGTCGGRQ